MGGDTLNPITEDYNERFRGYDWVFLTPSGRYMGINGFLQWKDMWPEMKDRVRKIVLKWDQD